MAEACTAGALTPRGGSGWLFELGDRRIAKKMEPIQWYRTWQGQPAVRQLRLHSADQPRNLADDNLHHLQAGGTQQQDGKGELHTLIIAACWLGLERL
jgi:hypothetical protein